jgi:hypothetical protein
VVLPASLQLAPARSVTEIDSALRAELTNNLELTQPDLESHLRVRGFASDLVKQKVAEQFLSARRAAMTDRIRQELQRAPLTEPELYQLLIPVEAKATAGLYSGISVKPPLRAIFDEQYSAVQTWLSFSRFAVPVPSNVAPALATVPDALPLPAFSQAARACGFADEHVTEPVVRSMPMFVQCEGKLFGQWGLQFACAIADADINRAVITPTSVTIPSPSGDFVIPVRSQKSSTTGRLVPYMASISWWGTDDWETMYDWPGYQSSASHLPIAKVWDLCQTREFIRINNRAIDEAAQDLLESKPDKFGLDTAVWKQYLATNPVADDMEARKQIVEACKKTIEDSGYTPLLTANEADLKDDERPVRALLVRATGVMQKAMEQNTALAQQQAAQEQFLSSLVRGKGVLIGSTATGAMDMVTTPLHARCPGVVVHGAIANALLTRQWWRTAPWALTAILTIFLGLFIALATSWFSPINSVFTALVTLVGCFALNGLVLFDWGHWIVGAAGPMVAIALAWAGAMVTRLIVEGVERIRKEREVAVFQHEMTLAKNVQMALVPKEMPAIQGIEPFGWTKPADDTGGDLFDLWTLPDGRLGILVADASGHGLAPSVIVTQVRTLVRALSEIEKHPNGLLARVNARLAQDLEPARFVTCFLGFLDSEGRLDWASAGHGPMLWCAKEKEDFQSLDATALPLGIMPDYMGDEIGPLMLDIGGMLIVTSDGIFEAPNNTDEQFGIERVIETLKNHAGKSAVEIVAAIRDAVTVWQRDPEKPADDQTTVIIRRIATGMNVTILEEKAAAV